MPGDGLSLPGDGCVGAQMRQNRLGYVFAIIPGCERSCMISEIYKYRYPDVGVKRIRPHVQERCGRMRVEVVKCELEMWLLGLWQVH